MDKFQYFNGVKFTRDEDTGYYLNSTIQKRMHVYVWEFYNGPINEGYQIHHKDGDRGNNDIDNLQMLTKSDHMSLHGRERALRAYDWMIDNLLTNAVPASKEWHKSEEGREWHKEHYSKMSDKLHAYKEFECLNCGAKYTGQITGMNKFCSNKCKSAYRRKSGVDDEERQCEYCGKPFTANRYSKKRFCGKSCSNKAVPRLKSKESREDRN